MVFFFFSSLGISYFHQYCLWMPVREAINLRYEGHLHKALKSDHWCLNTLRLSLLSCISHIIAYSEFQFFSY